MLRDTLPVQATQSTLASSPVTFFVRLTPDGKKIKLPANNPTLMLHIRETSNTCIEKLIQPAIVKETNIRGVKLSGSSSLSSSERGNKSEKMYTSSNKVLTSASKKSTCRVLPNPFQSLIHKKINPCIYN
jgi:hypothetical protein